MSRIKELKAKHPVLALSVLDLLAMIDPTENNKYLGLLSQLIQNRMTNRIEHESVEEFQRIATRDGYPDAIVKNAPTEQLYLTYVLDAVIDPDTIRAVNEFIDLNERRLIEQNDIYPMALQVYSKNKKHIQYPCYIQPKLDGIRYCNCIKVECSSSFVYWTFDPNFDPFISFCVNWSERHLCWEVLVA